MPPPYRAAKYAAISAGSSGNNTVIAAVTGKKIRVLSYALVAAGAVTIQWQSGAGGTNLSGVMSLAANGGLSCGFNEQGWFETAAGALLNISLGGVVQVSGHISYIEVD